MDRILIIVSVAIAWLRDINLGAMSARDSSSSCSHCARVARHDRLLGSDINHSTLLRVLDLVRVDPQVLDDVTSRFQMRRRELKIWEEFRHTLELPRKSGPAFMWETTSFSKMLIKCLERCDVLREEVLSLYSREPCLPGCEWEMVVYFDETTPGSVLRPINSRKCWCIYVAIKNLQVRMFSTCCAAHKCCL